MGYSHSVDGSRSCSICSNSNSAFSLFTRLAGSTKQPSSRCVNKTRRIGQKTIFLFVMTEVRKDLFGGKRSHRSNDDNACVLVCVCVCGLACVLQNFCCREHSHKQVGVLKCILRPRMYSWRKKKDIPSNKNRPRVRSVNRHEQHTKKGDATRTTTATRATAQHSTVPRRQTKGKPVIRREIERSEAPTVTETESATGRD